MLRDVIDQQIVAHLVGNARASFAEIGDEVGLSPPAVKRRVDRLLDDGTIRGFTAMVEPAGQTEAFVELYCRGRTNPEEILATVRTIPQVIAAYTVTGDADALLHLRTEGTAEIEPILERIRSARHVERTKSVLVLSRLIDRPPVPRQP